MFPLPAGIVLHDRYRLVRPIGKGGMGAVYEAVDARLQNTVAVKQVIHDGLLAASAFEQEARLLAALRHPALPVVIDHFTDAPGQFLVMQYIEGEDLSRLLAHRQHPCTVDEVIAWARVILDALIYLHEHEPPVVHRDIKPANLRRTPRGEIVLLDFGLAKGGREDLTRLAGDRSVFGYTRRYAPPEQIAGAGTDARSDLYSLGATLFHLATGLPPPDASERLRAIEATGRDPFAARIDQPSAHSLALSQAIDRAMALVPADRFASARDMLDAITDASSTESAKALARHHPTTRRIDAAMPSQVEVGRQVDLLLQVRFADSPRLGLEDWPPRRRPDQIEQRSETFRLSYPEDPATRRPLPARLRVKLAAPDFVVAGESERTIEVPPDDFSPRMAFLLTARRPGTCRINVEVYTGENVFVGSVPIEAEGVGAAVAEPDMRVANLVLEILARQAHDAEREALMRARQASARMAVAHPEAIGAAPAGAPSVVDEAPRRQAAPAVAAEKAIAPDRRGWARRVALLVPVLFAALGSGWLLWNTQGARPTTSPPLASAPRPTAVPRGSDRAASAVPATPSAPPGTSPELARAESTAALFENERGVLNAVQEYQRELEKQSARMDTTPNAPYLVHCLSPSDRQRPNVVFESPTRARVTCLYTTREEPKRSSTGQIILEKQKGAWRVISGR